MVAKIRNQYNQVPHLTQDTTWENYKNTIKHHKRQPSDQLFPSRWPQGSTTYAKAWQIQDINNTNDPKSQLRGRKLENSFELKAATMTIITILDIEWYLNVFSKWVSRHMKCIWSAGEYFEKICRVIKDITSKRYNATSKLDPELLLVWWTH